MHRLPLGEAGLLLRLDADSLHQDPREDNQQARERKQGEPQGRAIAQGHLQVARCSWDRRNTRETSERQSGRRTVQASGTALGSRFLSAAGGVRITTLGSS